MAKKRRICGTDAVQIEDYIRKRDQQKQQQSRAIEIIPRGLNQEKYVSMLFDPNCNIAIASGPAGTGKTMLAMVAAIKAFKTGAISKIVLTRPAVEVEDEQHGFLPGTLLEKMAPWTRPLFDVLHEHFRPAEVLNMIEEQTLEVAPLAYMRGRTFKDTFIVADEMQNATPNQLKMLMTRIGDGSKIAITGDVNQTDRVKGDNGLADLMLKLDNSTSTRIQCVQFTSKDVKRHPVVPEVLKLYGEES